MLELAGWYNIEYVLRKKLARIGFAIQRCVDGLGGKIQAMGQFRTQKSGGNWLIAAAIAIVWLGTSGLSVQGQESPSRVLELQPGLELTLLAEHPDLVTPTGIGVDSVGNLWVVACHTHFRPEGYVGPEHDEVWIFDSTGKNRRLFYNRTKTTMQLLLEGSAAGPSNFEEASGWVYLAQRDRILRVRDTDGDGVGDQEETIAALDTVADYPHNGLSGMAWHTDGGLIFSLGENFGKDWVLRGADGRELRGRGEGGVFHCARDGKGLRRIAQGFWNPFGLWMRQDGVLFAAENDPGSRPPCRLLHVVEGGDYGFQYVYGSASVHPFVCWNGELRGTLGMIHPCGEGPCAVVGLGGGVMVPSWSNHCIDYFPLHWKGATLQSQRIELLRGSDLFRPVAMVAGLPRKGDRGIDFYFTDWVSPSYELHGMGRLWKLRIDPEQATWMQPQVEPKTPQALQADAWLGRENGGGSQEQREELFRAIEGSDPFLAHAAIVALGREAKGWELGQVQALPLGRRLATLVALRKSDFENPKWVQGLWSDRDIEIRFECLRWVSDGVFKECLPQVESMLTDAGLEYRLFEAALAAYNTLQGKASAGVTEPGVLVERILSKDLPPAIQAYALRLVPAGFEGLSLELLDGLWDRGDEGLRREVVRTLAMRKNPASAQKLLAYAKDVALPEDLRLDAIAGLVNVQEADLLVELRGLLDPKAGSSPAVLAEVQRVMRGGASASREGSGLQDAGLQDVAVRKARLERMIAQGQVQAGDVQRGRRIFFHSSTVACSQCHRHEGRGNVVGPELSLVGRQGTAKELLQSIMEPNRDVAPQFYTTALELADGTTFTGILLRSSSTEVYRNNFGDEVSFQKRDILQRKELRSSMMPSGLLDTLSDEEVIDLLAFLEQSK